MILFFVLVLASVFVGVLIYLIMGPGPSVDSDGSKRWFNSKCQLHRVDGPAVEYADGDKWWYLNGEVHREDGPAIEDADGSKYWYKNGKRHRLDGPAVEGYNGHKEWWIDNHYITEQEFLARTCGSESTMIEDFHGAKLWLNSKGEYHRTDGPACEYTNGDKSWYQNGKLHRLDGPAVEWYSRTEYWIEGQKLTEQEFLARTSFNTPADWYAIALKDKKFQDAHLKYEKQQFQRCAIPELALNDINKSNYHK